MMLILFKIFMSDWVSLFFGGTGFWECNKTYDRGDPGDVTNIMILGLLKYDVRDSSSGMYVLNFTRLWSLGYCYFVSTFFCWDACSCGILYIIRMDSLVYMDWGRFKGELHSFPAKRFFPMGFTLGRFLRRQSPLDCYFSTSLYRLDDWYLVVDVVAMDTWIVTPIFPCLRDLISLVPQCMVMD